MSEITVAATQMACSWNTEENLDKAETLVREAVPRGAQIVLIQELFATPYFCIEQHAKHLELARELDESPVVQRMADLAKELGVVLPTSWFERSGNVFFNSLAAIDADGSILGVYRKSHIPNAVGYQEKHYFSPGDTGFKVWETCYARLGVGICWDQWFPEAARCMALQGADILMYPTAIGSEPGHPGLDSPLQRSLGSEAGDGHPRVPGPVQRSQESARAAGCIGEAGDQAAGDRAEQIDSFFQLDGLGCPLNFRACQTDDQAPHDDGYNCSFVW